MTPELNKNQIGCLRYLETRDFLRPMDIGGKDGSHHSATLASLAKLGLVERKKRHAIHCMNGVTSRQKLVGHRWVYTHNHRPYEGCSCRGSCVYRRTRKGTAWLRLHAAIHNCDPQPASTLRSEEDMSDFRKELAERMAELERERIEAEPWCIGKRVIKDKKAEDGFCVVDEGGETVASYRELLQRGRARDFVPFGDPPSVPGLIAVFHPAAMSLVEDLDVFKKMARRFDSDVFVYQEGGKWWLIALAEPEYGEGRNLFVVHPDGKSKVLAAS